MNTEHKWHECNCKECLCGEETCCDVCGGFEGTLTTDCCGRPITLEEAKHIYIIGDLDFRDGKWVCRPNLTRFENGLFICLDGVKRTKEEFYQWREELKVDEATVTDTQIARMLG